ncbi:MAG TPA: FtsX-like permease family protein [Acidimicrobiales bacterium]|nr:FtsX-like permease family protein [Acidimicrobiales bacterium]
MPLSGRVLRTAWYRLGATFHRRRGAYLSVVLLVGLVGGLAMGALAGARRTQSAFPDYLAATDASDLQLQTYNVGSLFGGVASPTLSRDLAHLPHVEHVASAPNLLLVPLGPNGKAIPALADNNDVTGVGSTGGMYFHQDEVAVTEGRMADPRRADEMVATAEAAALSDWHVGETVRFGAFSGSQLNPTFNPVTARPAFRFSVKLVGLVAFSNQIVNDDVDRFPTDVLMTPALTRRVAESAAYPYYGLKLYGGSREVATVEHEIIGLLPRGSVYTFHVTSVVVGQVERATKPEAIALGVFGAIAGLAALLIAGLAISRALWVENDDLDALRGLGADPVTITADAALGILGAVVLGSVLAVVVAVALSPLAPLGPVRQVDSSPGLALDWTVLGSGLAVLVVGLGGLTVALAHRRSNALRQARAGSAQGSGVVNAAARAGLRPPALAGLRFSLERGRGRSAVPVRSALIGAVLAVVVVVATVTFGSGLRTLVSHPALYGWNWSYAITSSPTGANVPPVVGRLLDADPDVAAWTGYSYADVQVDGLTVPALLSSDRTAVAPPILTGHALAAGNQVVLGSATLAALHKKVGDTVTVSYGSPRDAPIYVPPTRLVIAGTATMPAVGTSGALHPSMGTGVMIPNDIGPKRFKEALRSPDPNLNGPNIEVVRLRPHVAPAAGLASMRRIADQANRVMAADPEGQGNAYVVLGVQRPAEIVNYQSTGATPALLAAGLAAGAVVALGLTLAASVRRRRRDMAVLKTLGFTRRQLAATVAWQASVAAGVGVVVGVPVGIALGRWLWTLFARQIYSVPNPTVPALEVLAIVLGALVLANLVAAVPGRIAARTPTALVLRAE